jgi:protein subunit release factor A
MSLHESDLDPLTKGVNLMKRNKPMKGTRKMTQLQLALAELKTAKHAGSEAATLEDWVKDCLIPQLNATKKKVILYVRGTQGSTTGTGFYPK